MQMQQKERIVKTRIEMNKTERMNKMNKKERTHNRENQQSQRFII